MSKVTQVSKKGRQKGKKERKKGEDRKQKEKAYLKSIHRILFRMDMTIWSPWHLSHFSYNLPSCFKEAAPFLTLLCLMTLTVLCTTPFDAVMLYFILNSLTFSPIEVSTPPQIKYFIFLSISLVTSDTENNFQLIWSIPYQTGSSSMGMGFSPWVQQ